jgi:hypothetical protein
LGAAATDRMDEHLMGCASCSAEAARVAAVVSALRELVPPVITRAALETMRARGVRIAKTPSCRAKGRRFFLATPSCSSTAWAGSIFRARSACMS